LRLINQTHMANLILKILKWFLTTRTKYRANLYHFRKSVKEAERLAYGTNKCKGRRTYVYFLGGKYRVVNRKQVQWLKNQGAIKRSMNLEKMQCVLCYDTQGHINSHTKWTQLEIKGIDITYRRNALRL